MSGVYPWQQGLWQDLRAYMAQQRIPQALLLSGRAGWGKRHLAQVFASALLCRNLSSEQTACGHCQSCKLLQAETHPDYLFIEPDEVGKAIGIDKIRQLIAKLALKPHFDSNRVVLIQPAEAFNIASANAFLKCLEEPTERTCIILLSEQPGLLPATIRSRCQKISCRMPDQSMAVSWLQQQGVDSDQALLLALANGSPLLAKRYAEQQIITRRQDYFGQWLQIAQGKRNLLSVAEQWQKQEGLALSVVLNWLAHWITDIIKLKMDPEVTELRNPDFKKSLQGLAERLELKRLYAYYDKVLVAASQLSTQVNKQLLVEQLLIDWSQLNLR